MLYAIVNELYLNLMTEHLPVLQREVLEYLAPRRGQRFLDCTFGGGGHTRVLLEAEDGVAVTSLDCDPEAKARTEGVAADFGDRFTFNDLNFVNLDKVEEGSFDGILFDLGVSSFQLDSQDRGFSFRYEALTDMRFDPRQGFSAADFLEAAPKEELIRAIREYGEEKHWSKVVEAIMAARGTGVLQNASKVAELIANVIPVKPGRPTRIHPATKTFQGIRILINRELEFLEIALKKAMDKLAPGGVLAVISFHSLEDRIVKRFFRRMAGQPEHEEDSTPQDFRDCRAEILTKKPIRPSAEEIILNSRSRSAKLRVLRKM